MRTHVMQIITVFAIVSSLGCKKSDSASSSGGPGNGGTGDPSKASKVETPAKASQLVGSWVHTTPADMDALEFQSNGKVLMYMGGGGQAMTADYSVLDDGRLNLSMGGLATFHLPSINGDQLQLKDPDNGKITTYRRLKSGETIGAAMAGQDQADQQSTRNRNAALPEFLTRRDLVMVVNMGAGGPNGGAGFISGVMINGSKDAPPRTAIEFGPANGKNYVGRAYYDTSPPRFEPVAARIEGSADKPILSMIFGPGTVDQNGGRGVVDFHVEGSAPNISLKASLDYGGARLSDMIIRSDSATHKEITDHIKAQGAQLDTLKQPVMAMLKDYAVLKGTSQSMTPSEREGFADQFVLARNPQNNTWIGQGQSVNRASGATDIFPVVAAVGIVNGKPVMQIASQKRVYQFANIDTTGGKFTGMWQLPNNPNGRSAELSISQAVDSKGRDELFAARKTALQHLSGGTMFHAIINDQYTDGSHPPNAVTVTLTAGTGGAFTGKAEYPLEGCTMDLSGNEVDTPLGP